MSGDRTINSVNHSPVFRLQAVLNSLVHIAMGVVFYIVLHYAITKLVFSTNLKLHVIFSATGYQFLMLEGILTFSGTNSWSFLMSKTLRRWVHLVLQVLGAIFVIVGFSLAVVAKNDFSGKHFTSGHGICGLIGFIFTLISTLNGTVTFLAPKLRDKIRPTVVKFVHTLCGCVAISMGLITLCIGLNKTIFGHTETVVLATVFASLALAFTLTAPAISIMGYLANMRSTEL